MPRIAAVILAAGESRRMGFPKQLLTWGDTTLLGRAVRAARGSACSDVMLVVGAHRDRLDTHDLDSGVHIVPNPVWFRGLGTSLAAAVRALSQLSRPVEAAVFMRVDQPFVTSAVLDRLIDVYVKCGRPIVASGYGGRLGVPALFSGPLFPELDFLFGKNGATSILHRHGKEVEEVSFPEGAFEIDTPEDYARLRDLAEVSTPSRNPSP